MTTATKKHYLLAPSAAHRWLVCSGEPALRDKCPSTDTEYTREGTTAHWVGEQCLNLEREPYQYIGQVCPETGMTVTDEMTVAVKVYVDFCRSVRGVWNRVESKFTLPDLSSELGGTGDYGSVSGVVLDVVDYKHGSGKSVQAENNPQLYLYALGQLEKLKESRPDLYEQVKSIRLTIVQPRIEGEDVIRMAKLLLSELIEWRDKELKPAIKRTKTEPTSYTAGEHCFFCPAKATCPAQYERNLSIAQLDFADPVPAHVTPLLPDLKALTIDQIARIVIAKDGFVSWLGACEEHLQNVLQQGTAVSGFKLVKKRSNRAWTSEQNAEKFLVEKLGAGAYAPREILTVAQAEKALKVFDAELAPSLVFKPDNGCVLAPESDKRPAALLVSAAQEFATADVDELL